MSRVKKIIARGLSALLATLIALGLGFPAYAAPDNVSVSLPVSQKFINHMTTEVVDRFSYVLTPQKTGNPMPGQSVQRYSFTMKGTEEVKLPEIVFTQVGTYSYELKQTVENKTKGYTYDGRTYTIEIYVTNAADGGLAASNVVYTENGEKADRISFENSYRVDTTPTEPSTSQKPGSTPQTGDQSRLGLWLVLLVLSGAGFASVLVTGKKQTVNRDSQAK